ncbi:MAG TPA: hypothetical protein VFJ15_06620 [Oleiagrimonas sp.]|nr:hypothetical protein [Oleiagrimonas sp.]
MAASNNLLTAETDPGVLDVVDARIPELVRARFDDYGKTVDTVVPVIGISREEWWLFDADGVLVDVLCRQAGSEIQPTMAR